ncbi:MAG TPA: hypothetical protein VLJ86_25660 [Ramlibacter sp.]|nr:hypothetical protein [Ramlibacter sp.]
MDAMSAAQKNQLLLNALAALGGALKAYEDDFRHIARQAPTAQTQKRLAEHFRALRAYIADLPDLWLALSELFIAQVAVIMAAKERGASPAWHKAMARHAATTQALQQTCKNMSLRLSDAHGGALPEPATQLFTGWESVRRELLKPGPVLPLPDLAPAEAPPMGSVLAPPLSAFVPAHADAQGHGKIGVFVLAPQPAIGRLRRLLRSAGPNLELAGVGSRLEDVEANAARRPSDLTLVDPGACDLAELLRRIKAGVAGRVVVTTKRVDAAWLDEAILAGLRGILDENAPAAIVREALEEVSRGELWIDQSALNRVFMEMVRCSDAQGQRHVRMELRVLQTAAEGASGGGLQSAHVI